MDFSFKSIEGKIGDNLLFGDLDVQRMVKSVQKLAEIWKWSNFRFWEMVGLTLGRAKFLRLACLQ